MFRVFFSLLFASFSFYSFSQPNEVSSDPPLFNLVKQKEYFSHQLKMIDEARQKTPANKYIPTVIKYIDTENPQTQIDGGLNPGEFAITLDDGPDPRMTQKILNVLDEYGVKANYFIVGINAKRFGGLLKGHIKAGHTIGTHTYHHVNMPGLYAGKGRAAAEEEIESGIEQTQNAVDGVVYPFFRFPFGAFNKNLLEITHDLELVDFFWSSYSFSKEMFIPKKVLRNGQYVYIKNSGILLKHDTGEHPGFDLEMRNFLTMMKKEDYKAVLLVPLYLKP